MVCWWIQFGLIADKLSKFHSAKQTNHSGIKARVAPNAMNEPKTKRNEANESAINPINEWTWIEDIQFSEFI